MERMILVNKYDEEICELEWNKGTCFYRIKDEDMDIVRYLDEGDELRVKKVWTEA